VSGHALLRCKHGSRATHVALAQCDESGSTWCEIEYARTSARPGVAATCRRTHMFRTSARWPRSRAASRCVEPWTRRPDSHPLGPVSRTAGGISSDPLAFGGRSLYSADMDASVPVREPASHKGWRSVRSSLQLILAILVVCAWANSTALVLMITNHPMTFEWLPRIWQQQLQASVLFIAPGMLAARLASRGYPTSLRMSIRTVVAFVLGSAVGHWLAFWLIPPDTGTGKVWPLSVYANSLLFLTLMAAAVVGAMYVLVATRNAHPPGVASHANGSAGAEG